MYFILLFLQFSKITDTYKCCTIDRASINSVTQNSLDMISGCAHLIQHMSRQSVPFYISFSVEAIFFVIVIFDRVYTSFLCIPTMCSRQGCSWSEKRKCYVIILMIIDWFKLTRNTPAIFTKTRSEQSSHTPSGSYQKL